MSDKTDAADKLLPPLPTRARDRRRFVTAAQARNVGALTALFEQVEECERLMVMLKPPATISLDLVARFGITRRQADAYQAHVRRRWAKQGGYEGREQRLDRYRKALEAQVEGATEDGDRKAAIAALAVLIKLEGVSEAALVDRMAQLVAQLSRTDITDEELDTIAEQVGWKLPRKAGDHG